MLRILFILLLATSSISLRCQAQTYKCKVAGSTIYSQTQCDNSGQKPVTIKTQEVNIADYKAAMKANAKRSADARQLQKIRERSEAQNHAKLSSIAAKNAHAQKQCDTQQMRAKWAKEDLASAQPKREMKARSKLNRAEEKMAFACKNG
jgi:hypothetical protein